MRKKLITFKIKTLLTVYKLSEKIYIIEKDLQFLVYFIINSQLKLVSFQLSQIRNNIKSFSNIYLMVLLMLKLTQNYYSVQCYTHQNWIQLVRQVRWRLTTSSQKINVGYRIYEHALYKVYYNIGESLWKISDGVSIKK